MVFKHLFFKNLICGINVSLVSNIRFKNLCFSLYQLSLTMQFNVKFGMNASLSGEYYAGAFFLLIQNPFLSSHLERCSKTYWQGWSGTANSF